MSHQEKAAPSSADMGLFERYLSLWVAAAIVAGIALGQWAPAIPEALSRFEYDRYTDMGDDFPHDGAN